MLCLESAVPWSGLELVKLFQKVSFLNCKIFKSVKLAHIFKDKLIIAISGCERMEVISYPLKQLCFAMCGRKRNLHFLKVIKIMLISARKQVFVIFDPIDDLVAAMLFIEDELTQLIRPYHGYAFRRDPRKI